MTVAGVVPSIPREDVRLTFPDGAVLGGPKNVSLEEYLQVWEDKHSDVASPVTAVLLEGKLTDLRIIPGRDAAVLPLDLTTSEGMRAYKRSLSLVLVVACRRLFPDVPVSIEHSITGNGFFCTTSDRPPLTETQVAAIEAEMRALVQADLPISTERLPTAEAVAWFQEAGYEDTVRLLRSLEMPTIELHELAGEKAVFFGVLTPSTGVLNRFRLEHQADGFLLLFPLREDPARFPGTVRFPQLTRQFRIASRWLRTIGAEDVGSLNRATRKSDLRELVLVAEALHERTIAEIAYGIIARPSARIILIAGPSSAGKTTFSKRLGVQLAAGGVPSFAIAMDDYFVERQLTPVDEAGQLDFEAFEAVDHALFSRQMALLLAGEPVRMPRYDFRSGIRNPGPQVQLPPGTALIVEGLHGLNPRVLADIPPEALTRVYVSSLTQLNIDRHSYVHTSDARLLRRLVRDARTRGHNAEATILRWESVRRGERRHIHPYQERADVMFNSALPYEIAVLKPLAEPLLLRFDHSSPVAVEVRRLLELLALFAPATSDVVPDNSILREFIGGSILQEVDLSRFGRLRVGNPS